MRRLPPLLITLLFVSGSLSAQQIMFPPVRGTKEMVAAANNFEVEAGFRVLAAGGNAVDAGVASTLAAAVTEQARFGLGGEMPLIITMKGKPPIVISGVGTAPKLATVDYYTKRKAEFWEEDDRKVPIPGEGIRAAILPGVMDGLLLALQKYGSKSFAEVAQPAIEYAEGFPIGEEFSTFIRNGERLLAGWPTSKKFFLPNGEAPAAGTMMRMPDLAKTLRELATAEKKTRGNRAKKIQAVRDYFYRGPIAQKIAKFSEENGGLIRFEDLKGFSAIEDTPRTTTYRGYTIVKPGFWTQGPVMLQALNILEGFDLKAMGHNSPALLHTEIEAVKLAFADRDAHYGDPLFSKINEKLLLSKEYAAERRKLINPDKADMGSRPGKVAEEHNNVQDTTCVNVVDRFGNAFNATPSGAWLPSVIAGDTGIPLSGRLQSFVLTKGHANELAPGKRPRVTLSPTTVLKPDGSLHFVMSTPGGDNQDQAMLQVLINLIDFGMGPQQAVEAPRFQTEHFYSSFAHHEFVPGRLRVEGRVSRSVIEALRAKGHMVTPSGDWSNGSAPTVILLKDGILDGGADPRRLRFIFGR
ncbi:MAG: gamma-glutamyltransferase family protein [Acidobacteriota bacterium]|jgi:gamma-glutamyltranspeptidase/glutathione hydrolase|nr:gamma-glutamyltransferase family protein [Bryobacteraceae bacterium CoA2 C42]